MEKFIVCVNDSENKIETAVCVGNEFDTLKQYKEIVGDFVIKCWSLVSVEKFPNDSIKTEFMNIVNDEFVSVIIEYKKMV